MSPVVEVPPTVAVPSERPMHTLRRPLLVALVALVVFAAACSYENAGTTTSTQPIAGKPPPPLGPADVLFEAQRVDGSLVNVASVSLPADGFVVLRADEDGTPGEVVGVSDIVAAGTFANVPVVLFVPLETDAPLHAALHIDMDRDGEYTFEPPDDFTDAAAVSAAGTPASTSAAIVILPPLASTDVAIDTQRTDGESVVVTGVTLPAPGFVVVQIDEDGTPGSILGFTDLLPEGVTTGIEIELSPRLIVTGPVWVTAYVDRNENGLFRPGTAAGDDEPGISVSGRRASAMADILVVPRQPAEIVAVDQEISADQEADGTILVVEAVTLPAGGFVVVRADIGGAPGGVLGISEPLPLGTAAAITIALADPLEDGDAVWLRAHIDFDGDGIFGGLDIPAVTRLGALAEVRLVVTVPAPPDDTTTTSEA